MSIEKTIRDRARNQLKRKGFTKAVFGIAFMFFFFMLFQYSSIMISTILYEVTQTFDNDSLTEVLNIANFGIICILFFAVGPVIMGYIRMFLTDKDDYNIADVFYFYSTPNVFFSGYKLCFSFFIRIIMYAILFLLPSQILDAINSVDKKLINDIVFEVMYNSLVILGVIALVAYCTRYFLVVPLFCENQSKSIRSYFYESVYLMKYNKAKVLKLLGSFVWWILLCFTVLPILYVLPYFTQSMCISGKYILELSRNGRY